MPDRLSGCRAKLDRVYGQLTHLESLIRSYGQSAYVPVHEHDHKTGERVKVARGVSEPDVEISVLVGEIAHNLRSALNYVAWACVDVSKKARRTKGSGSGRPPKVQVQFPICKSPAAFISSAASYKGVSKQRTLILESLQPYSPPYDGRNYHKHPLWILQEINNRDKHRLILVQQATVSNTVLGYEPGKYVRILKGTKARLEDGQVLGPDEPVPDDPAQPYRQTASFVDVVFAKGTKVAEGLSVSNTLREIHWYIEEQVMEDSGLLNGIA